MTHAQAHLDPITRAQTLGLWFSSAVGERALAHLLACELPLNDILRHGHATFWEAIRRAHPRSRPSLTKCAKRGPDHWYEQGQHALEALQHVDAAAIMLGEPCYPPQLAATPNAPPILSYRGDVRALSRTMIAVVGTRRASPLGRSLCRRLIEATTPFCDGVVSGGAVGVDAVAHRTALDQDQLTVLVSGTGIDRIYPASHARLFDEVAEQGAVVSQFPPGVTVRKGQFPRRNATIAGLSQATLVVEAPTGSGALYTASAAQEIDRPVLVAAGPAFKATFSGGLELVSQGLAMLVHDATSLIRHAQLQHDPMPLVTASLGQAWSWPRNAVARTMVERLLKGPCHREVLLGLGPAGEVAEQLLVLELEGLVQRGMDDAFMLNPALASPPDT